MRVDFQPGDKVVYIRDKFSSCPGPRAKNVLASPRGETYEYQVEKYWVVVEALAEGTIVVQTRRGKQHQLQADDPRLRHANFIERIFRGKMFPSLSHESQRGRYSNAALKS